MRLRVAVASASGIFVLGLSGCGAKKSGALIPLTRPPTTVGSAASTSTIPLGAGAGPDQSGALALSNAAFALHRDVTLLVKQTAFHDPLVALGDAVKNVHSALEVERTAALANAPNCTTVRNDYAAVVAAAAAVDAAHQSLLNKVAQVDDLSTVVSADRANLTQALSQVSGTPAAGDKTTTDAQAALAAAVHDQATSAAAVTASLSSGAASVNDATQDVAEANASASKTCP